MHMPIWKTQKLRSLARALLSIKKEEEMLVFLRDVATLEELRELANRWEVAKQLDQGRSYRDIGRRLKVSTATVTRIAHWLNNGEGGYKLALSRRKKGS